MALRTWTRATLRTSTNSDADADDEDASSYVSDIGKQRIMQCDNQNKKQGRRMSSIVLLRDKRGASCCIYSVPESRKLDVGGIPLWGEAMVGWRMN